MTFIWPAMLLGLLLVPLFVVLYVQLQDRRRRLLAAYGVSGSTPAQARRTRAAGALRHVPPAVFLTAFAILMVALARPQSEVTLPVVKGTIILAFDVSGSMAADDMKPTRLDAAKQAALSFVERQPPGVEIGVVTFSGSALPAQAPTTDSGLVAGAINRLQVQTSTSLGQGIQASLNAIAAAAGRTGDITADEPPSLSAPPDGEPGAAPTPTPVPPGTYTSAAIVLLTDGENNVRPDPLEAAKAAADRGVRIYTVGVGSAAGATLNLDGFTVRSRLDEPTLQQIAQVTGGEYYNAQTEAQLQSVYDNLNPQLVFEPQHIEVTALYAGAGMLLMLLGSALSLLWLGRLV